MIQNPYWSSHVERQFGHLLKSLGVSKIEAKGKKFDPMLHEAIEIVETENEPDGTVIEEVRSGYMINGHLLKPAQVKVARGKTNDINTSKD